MTELSQLQYDISTFTAADFTVELNISPAAYEDFLTNQYEPKGKKDGYSPGMYLKLYLKSRIDKILSHSH